MFFRPPERCAASESHVRGPALNPTHLMMDVAGYFDPAPGSTISAADSSANANHGAVENGVALGAGWMGGVGGATFNGANTYIDLGTDSSLMPAGGITASAWIKAPATQVTFPQILSAGDSTGTTGYNLYLWSQGYPAFIVKEGSNAWGSCYVRGPAPLNNNGWHLVTGVYTGSTIGVYVDGALAGSANCTNQGANYGGGPRGEIGWKLDAGANDDFSGTLEEVRLSNMARSADWIATEYNNQDAPASFSMTGATQAMGVTAPFGITGQVTAVQNGTTINLTGVTMTLARAASRSAQTNAGNYGFASLTPGAYTVTPTWPGASFSPASAAVTFSTGGSQSATFSFTATGLYTLTVGVGISNASVTLTGGPPGAPATSAGCDTNGNCAFTGLFPGTYLVSPSQAGYTFTGNPSVTLTSSQTIAFTPVACDLRDQRATHRPGHWDERDPGEPYGPCRQRDYNYECRWQRVVLLL